MSGPPTHARRGSRDRADRIWGVFNGGCHPNRDTETAIIAAGFRIEACRRFDFRPCLLAAPVAPHILGRATPGMTPAAVKSGGLLLGFCAVAA